MWATIPVLQCQPVLELVPSESGSELQLYGYPDSDLSYNPFDFAYKRYSTNTRSVLVERHNDHFGAFHGLLSLPNVGSLFRVQIGNRYSMRLQVVYDYGEDGVSDKNGIDRIIGHAPDALPYIQMDFLDDETSMASLALHRVFPLSISALSSGTAIGFGYVLEAGTCRMYGFALNHRVGSIALDDAVCFGAGTVMRTFEVDQADAGGTLSIEMIRTQFHSGMGHYGPFLSRKTYKPDSTIEKRSRQGTTIGSLRSNALNWGQPLPYTGTQAIAEADCAGHSEYVQNGIFVSVDISLYVAARGSTWDDAAYLKPDVDWNSNLSNVAEDNERLARLSIALSDTFAVNRSGGTFYLPAITWTASTETNGNNEYTAFRTGDIVAESSSAPDVTYVRQNVFVSLSLYEDIENRQAAALADVTLSTRCRVAWTVFLITSGGSGLSVDATPAGVRDLSDAEFASLLAGDPVEIHTGLTIQGIGAA